MRSIVFTLLFISFQPKLSSDADSFFELADSFFQKHIQNGLVKYQTVNSDPASLNELVKLISEINLAGTSAEERKAFYINAYNLLVIKGIIEKYPISSPMKIAGFFDAKKYTVAGEKLTLNDLEKKKLLKTTEDARLHFVLVCAAMSCPKIVNFAYRPGDLNKILNQRTTTAINDPGFIRVEAKKVLVSEIFNWYRGDFIKDSNSILDYLNQYRNSTLNTDLKLGYYEYDWSLNEYKR